MATVTVGCRPFADHSDLESIFLVTMLGQDTLAIENYAIRGAEVFATVLTRAPQTNLVRYHLQMNDSLQWQSLTEQHLHPQLSKEDSVLRERKLYYVSDSVMVIETETIRRINRAEVRTGPEVLPYQDMMYWPYEIALQKMQLRERSFLRQYLISGQRLLNFEILRQDTAKFVIRHPTRGNMIATVGADRHINQLDAESSTRKLRVERTSPVNLKRLAVEYTQRERQGEALGALSGRGRTEKEIGNALITIDYGRPAKRGRRLFGDLVPWGQVWRTGANMATHFSTDTTLLFANELEVLPGEYTLFTIPEPTGGQLILNRQTGQNGRSYDSSLNLGSVPMRLVSSTGDRELFTIDVRTKSEEGVLELIWGNTQFEVEFRVQ